MAKKEIGFIKLQIPAGKANPAPPVGPALGQHGVNIMEFCKAFNSSTQDQPGMIIPVEIIVYADRTFSYITKTPPASALPGEYSQEHNAPYKLQRSVLSSYPTLAFRGGLDSAAGPVYTPSSTR